MTKSMHGYYSYQGGNSFDGDGDVELDDNSLKLVIIVPLFCASMVFCLIFWCTVAIHGALSHRDVLSTETEKGIPVKMQKDEISQSFEVNRNQMIVKKDDLKYNNDSEAGVNTQELDEDDGGGLLILRVGVSEAGKMSDIYGTIDTHVEDNTDNRKDESLERMTTTTFSCAKNVVPDCCAICLDFYKVGETVVWSATLNNKSSKNSSCCPHVYHKECFIEYIMTHKGNGNPCPLCRQEYLPTQQPEQ